LENFIKTAKLPYAPTHFPLILDILSLLFYSSSKHAKMNYHVNSIGGKFNWTKL